MAHPDILVTKQHASVVITLQTQEDVDALQKMGGIMAFGGFVKTSHYTDKQPLKQCHNCWKYDHYQQTCKIKGATCRLCTGPHHEHSHCCSHCTKHNCEHMPTKCVNCDGNHPSDFAQCSARRAAIGSEHMGPKSKPLVGGRTKVQQEYTAVEYTAMEI